MSKDTKQLCFFKEISGKPDHVNFNGGNISSDSGVVLLQHFYGRENDRPTKKLLK